MTINLEVNAQKLTCLTDEYIAADTVNYIGCKFSFSEEWNGFIKTAVFSSGTDNYSVLLEDSMCIVPKEVLSGVFGISVYGTQTDTEYKRITSDIVYITVYDSGYTEGQTPQAPTPDVYETIAVQYAECKERLNICEKELEKQSAYKIKSIPHTALSGNPIAITDALADEQPLKMRVYGDGIGDLNNGKYEIPIKITGKNMFDISKITKFVAGNYSTNMNSYFTKTDNIITSNIGLYGMSAYWYDSKIKFPTGTYTLSADFMADKDSGNKNVSLGFRILSDSSYKNKTFTVNNYRTWERFSYTFEVGTESDIIPLIQAVGEAGDYTNLKIKIKNVQIEQGDTATEYEPYLEHTAAAMLDTPLSDGEYIDLASKKRNGETDITVNGNITLFDGANNITCQTEISPSKLEVSYYQDINKVLEKLKNAS